MVLAVLEARCGLSLSDCDIFLNVAGGIRITEPAADLAVAAALISSQLGKPVQGNSVFFGEVGLSGEIRTVAQPDLRLKEAAKLGFDNASVPSPPKKKKLSGGASLNVRQIDHLDDLVQQFQEMRRAA